MNRRGFSLAELIVVLSVLGILVAIVAPKAQEALARGRAAALIERVASVRLAYESLSAPSAESLKAPAGTVPPALSPALADGFFRGEGGIELSITGAGPNAWVALRSTTPAQLRIREAFHLLAGFPHLHSETVTMVPLGAFAAATTVRPVVVLKLGASTDTVVTSRQPPQKIVTMRPLGAVTDSTKTSFTPGAPPCSAALSPDLYRQCQPQGSSGWFRQ